MKFELFQNEENEKFYFHLKAKNGQVILASQGYTTKAAAKNGIESVMKNATSAANFQQLESSDGKPYFTLMAQNKQVIGNSQMYASKDGMEKGIKSVMENAPGATLDDKTVEG